MSATDLAYVTGPVVRWAIQRARVTPDKVAKKLHAKPAAVTSWEEGKSFPTFSQAQKLADVLHVPFGYFFLASPPEETIPLTDFRTVSGKRAKPTPELIDVVNDVIVKQQWYRDFLLKQGANPLPFVGQFSMADGVATVAKGIRETLRIDNDLRQGCTTWAEFFRLIVRNAEGAGILVLRSGIAAGNTRRPLSVEEFRGFAISDSITPLIFVNGRDWQRAQIFTIAHELVHIWLGAGGISNEDLKDPNLAARNDVEKFCNETAAEILVPRADFVRAWDDSRHVNENVDNIARSFKVSTLVALRRAFDLQRISRDKYRIFYEREERKFREVEEKRKGGGSFYNNVVARNSATLTNTVVQAALSGKVLYREAANLLNVNVPAIHKIARHLAKPKDGT